MGAARDYIGPAFDVILTAQAKQAPGTKVTNYSYSCEIGGKFTAKIRGQQLPQEAVKTADMKAIWQHLTKV